jgi:hypothetical protein
MKRTSAAMLSAALLFQVAVPAQAEEPVEISIAAECTTEGTKWDGSRSDCDSEWSTFTVPDGYVFAQTSYNESILSENGSQSQSFHEWADYVEIIPGTGISSPRTLRVRVHARSPSGKFQPGRRGWMKIKATAKYARYR